MRINSPKQTQASRENGANSKGAKSPWGRNRVRLNALKDGLFSKDVVIESVEERKEDFERLKKEMWDLFQPAGALEEMLVADIVENWCGLRRRVGSARSGERLLGRRATRFCRIGGPVRAVDRGWEAVFFNIQGTAVVFPGWNDFRTQGGKRVADVHARALTSAKEGPKYLGQMHAQFLDQLALTGIPYK